MSIKDLAKLKKEKTIHSILSMYANGLIYLTDKQIDKLIEEKDKKR